MMPLNKPQFLQDRAVIEFTGFLAEAIGSTDALQGHWFYDRGRQCNATINSFSSAYAQYCWKGKSADETSRELAALSNGLLDSCKRGDPFDFLISCYDVLQWGGGGKLLTSNVAWLVRQRRDVIKTVRGALSELTSHQPNLARFQDEFRSNAGFTKIYALMKPDEFVIYDSRVAAAIGLFITRFCIAQGRQSLPEALELCWMPANEANQDYQKLRDHSKGSFVFPTCGAPTTHQSSNIRANWLLEAALAKLRPENSSGWSLRKLESALCMIGYDLRNQDISASDCKCGESQKTVTGGKADELVRGHGAYSVST